MKKPLIILIYVLALPISIALTGCQTTSGSSAVESYNSSPLTVTVPSGIPDQRVERNMVNALTNRKWKVVESSPTRAVGTLDHRGFKAKVILERSGNTIRILSDATKKHRKTGEYYAAVPLGWLENLQQDLRVMLKNDGYSSF